MKKIMLLLALVATVGLSSCKKESKVSLDFGKTVYVLLADAPLTVDLKASAQVNSSVTVPVIISGTAVKGDDYTISAESFVIENGTNKASITITPLNNFTEGKEIILNLGAIPAGYEAGTNASAVVTVEKKESIIYSFTAEKADLLDTYKIFVSLTGATSGTNFTATSDMTIPVTLDGESTAVLGEDFEVVGGKMEVVVPAGTNKGSMTIQSLDNEVGEEKVAIFKLDPTSFTSRFIAGDMISTTITVKGILKFSSLVGTWEFVEIPGLDEWMYFVEDMGDDPELMPIHMDGYQFTFSLNEEGALVLTPGETSGDLNNLLRESTLTYNAPVNPALKYVPLGEFCTEEDFMFGGYTVQLTYFMMSNANRSFSADSETLGKAAVAMCINGDGNLEFFLRDYDQPPFMENWWDSDFDPDMFGFCYVMKRVK